MLDACFTASLISSPFLYSGSEYMPHWINNVSNVVRVIRMIAIESKKRNEWRFFHKACAPPEELDDKLDGFENS